MPSYIVQGTHIKHGRKGEKEAVLYGPGDVIELTVAEAERLGASVAPPPEAGTAKKGPGSPVAASEAGDGPKAEPEAVEPPAAGVGGGAPRKGKGK